MAEISGVAGNQSSIDTLVQRFISQERGPVNDLQSSKKELQRRLLVYTDLKSHLKSLNDLVKEFSRVGTLNNMLKKNATSSNEKYFNVTATGGAVLGNHSIKVDRVASGDTGISSQFINADNDLASSLSGTQEFTLAIGEGDPVTISVNIDPADTNEEVMNKIRTAINDSGLEVNASIIKDTSSTARLVIKSKVTGSENSLDLVAVGNSKLLETLGYIDKKGERNSSSGTSGGFLFQDFTELDAKLTIDGIQIIKGSNEITDVFEGVTINLNQAQEEDDTSLTLSVAQDTENAKNEIEKFIEKYNEVLKYLNEKTKVDTENRIRGDLAGDSIFRGLKYSMRGILSQGLQGQSSGDLQFLSQIGITAARDGTLSISKRDKFDDALNGDLEQVTKLFTSESGIGKSLNNLLKNFVSSGGRVDRTKKSIDRRITSMDVRIKNFEERLLLREKSLRLRFTDLQRTLNLLNSQQALISRQFSSFQSLGGSF